MLSLHYLFACPTNLFWTTLLLSLMLHYFREHYSFGGLEFYAKFSAFLIFGFCLYPTNIPDTVLNREREEKPKNKTVEKDSVIAR